MPESIVYDSIYNRYLVTNYATGSIVAIKENGSKEYFVRNMNATQGIVIVDSIAYVGCDSTVRGFYLESGEQLMNLPVNYVSNLNDITADSDGYLYVSDVFGTKIIKVYPEQETYTVFVNGQGIHNPNGITYDKQNDRLLVCSYRENFPIQAISLLDSTVTTLFETDLDYSDGITLDNAGNIYFTSWGTNSIYKLEENALSPEIIYTNDGGPADIYFDEVNSVIAIPLQRDNDVDFLEVESTSIDIRKSVKEIIVYPNPTDEKIFVKNNDFVKTQIYSMSYQLLKETKEKEIDISEFQNGTYILILHDLNRNVHSKLIIIR